MTAYRCSGCGFVARGPLTSCPRCGAAFSNWKSIQHGHAASWMMLVGGAVVLGVIRYAPLPFLSGEAPGQRWGAAGGLTFVSLLPLYGLLRLFLAVFDRRKHP